MSQKKKLNTKLKVKNIDSHVLSALIAVFGEKKVMSLTKKRKNLSITLTATGKKKTKSHPKIELVEQPDVTSTT